MRNKLFHWLAKVVKYRLSAVLSLALAVLLLVSVGLFAGNEDVRSVEFGLAELSPRGEMGGYAVPASGSSDPDPVVERSTPQCRVSFIANPTDSGTNTTMVTSFTYNGWSKVRSYWATRCDLQVWGTAEGCYSSSGPWYEWTEIGQNHNYNNYTGTPLALDTRSSNLADGSYLYHINVRFEGSVNTDFRDINCNNTLQIGEAEVGGPPSLTGDPIYVFRGGDTDLTWDTNGNDPASCTLTGPGVNLSSLTSSTGTHTVVVYGESTYTLTCPGGTDSVTIRVLPVLQET